jgi:hypothetical protein
MGSALTNLTLLDWAQRTDPSGTTPEIANTLSQTNEILIDAVYKEANDATTHTEIISTGLPAISFRALNQGIPSSKGTTTKVVEGMAIMEARSEVDSEIAKLNGNSAAFRRSEARLFMEAMNQKMAVTDIYGNASLDENSFTGFMPRYSSTTLSANGKNVLLGGSATEAVNTSILLICWGDQTVFKIFPKGSTAGLTQRDLGEQTVYTEATLANRMQALVEWFQWKAGLVVKDWRYVVRIPNIQTTLFAGLSGGAAAPASFANLLHLMATAIARIPAPAMGRCAFYMNRLTFSTLMRLGLEKSIAALSVQSAVTQFGTPAAMMSFMGIPIRQCDAILNTEALVA